MPDGLLRYLEIRDRQRADVVARTLAAMTDRERALVREAAVMGYVRGAVFGAATARDIPDGLVILADVVSACLEIPDLYPAINNLTSEPYVNGEPE